MDMLVLTLSNYVCLCRDVRVPKCRIKVCDHEQG